MLVKKRYLPVGSLVLLILFLGVSSNGDQIEDVAPEPEKETKRPAMGPKLQRQRAGDRQRVDRPRSLIS